MKNNIPVMGFAAYSGTGKTTLIEKIIRILKSKGFRVAVVKHDAHDFEIDKKGKDSYRFSAAGSDITVIASDKKYARMEKGFASFKDILADIKDADIILVEGYKGENIPRIGLCRKVTGKGFTADYNSFIAIACDYKPDNLKVPCFDINDEEGIADFIIDYGKKVKNMEEKKDFSHFNDEGKARMVNVGDKEISHRSAVARGSVIVNKETFELIKSGGMKKGDVLSVAQVAGIMGAKKTPDIIPMCHPIIINGIDLKLSLNEEKCRVDIEACVACDGKTGVEMEALTAVSCAALTVYDMCKAVQKDMEITDICLLKKTGGVHGDFERG
ncbi:MAG: cyclic pyranopterin monophosphate synthase MoaC [Parasporobacterium sp.]|nr:cyclic pyranopterin monophosphate synthase MoaC [Parasporobacterium sp.]